MSGKHTGKRAANAVIDAAVVAKVNADVGRATKAVNAATPGDASDEGDQTTFTTAKSANSAKDGFGGVRLKTVAGWFLVVASVLSSIYIWNTLVERSCINGIARARNFGPFPGFLDRAAVATEIKHIINPDSPSMARFVLIHGEPGVGKTTLVQQAIESAAGGVVYVDMAMTSPPALKIAKAFDCSAPLLSFSVGYFAQLGAKASQDQESTPLEIVLSRFSDVAAGYSNQHNNRRGVTLVIDAFEKLLTSPKELTHLLNFAKIAVDKPGSRIKVVLVSSEGNSATHIRMASVRARMDFYEVRDVAIPAAIAYLQERTQSTDETRREEIATLVRDVVGGRLLDIVYAERLLNQNMSIEDVRMKVLKGAVSQLLAKSMQMTRLQKRVFCAVYSHFVDQNVTEISLDRFASITAAALNGALAPDELSEFPAKMLELDVLTFHDDMALLKVPTVSCYRPSFVQAFHVFVRHAAAICDG